MKKIGIYKIENLINETPYIGQSVDIYKRWANEKSSAYNNNYDCYDYPLQRAFRKYGIDNFSFEIIEECRRDELNDKEQYWIECYDSFNNGYNQNAGGDSILHMCKLNLQQVEEIINILQRDYNGEISHRILAQQYNISPDIIQGINCGRYWYNDDLHYPLHISKHDPRFKKTPISICVDCEKTISDGSKRCKECEKIYRKQFYISQKPISKEDLNNILLDNNGNFTQIGKMFGVNDNTIRKWCKLYDLPYHSSDYKIKQEHITNYEYNGSSLKDAKQVHQYDKQMNYIQSFESYADAAHWLVDNGYAKAYKSGIRTHIGEVVKGKRKTAYSFIWKDELI